jgi:hypothetical protein
MTSFYSWLNIYGMQICWLFDSSDAASQEPHKKNGSSPD